MPGLNGTDIKQFQGSPTPRRPPETLGFGVPTEAEVTAAGGTALEVVKDPGEGSWDTFAATFTTAGYVNIGLNGSQEYHLLIPTFRKTAFPS